ncbi:MAG: glycosyltransferase family 39 protein, partial [bacterium]|nr:glycosyltransferase family 39 protein [bacterium]
TIINHLKSYENPEVIGVAGRVINDNESIPKNTDVETGKTNMFGLKFLYQFWSTKKQNVDFVYGCNMSFRKSILIKVKGFDIRFPKIFEEVDLSYRIKKLGHIIFEPDALVFHHKAKTGGIRPEENQNKQKLIFSNYGHYLAKNISFPLSLISFIIRIRSALNISIQTSISFVYSYLAYFITPSNIIFLFLIVFGFFTRFWKLGEFFTFNFDEEYQALLAWEQVKHLHKIWIGVSASNVNYYLGPGFTYLNTLLFYISKDPIILGIFGSTFGLITAVSLYFVTKKLFTEKAGLFSLAFYIGSLFINIFDRRFWNPTPIIFLSIWMIYAISNLKKNQKWLIVIFAIMGIALHIHLSLLAFWPVIFVVSVITFLFKNNSLHVPDTKYIKIFFVSIATFILVTLPLLVFDFVHNFDNLLMPFRYITLFFTKHTGGNSEVAWAQLQNSLSRLWYIKPYSDIQNEIQLGVHGIITTTNPFLVMLSILILFWIMIKSIKNNKYRILALSMLSFICVYLFFPGGVVAYFMLGFFALFTMSVGIFFSKLPNYISIPIFVIFILINTYSLITLQQEQYGLTTRKKLIKKIMPIVKDKSFYLETITIDGRKYHSAGGWRYLFKAYGKTPSQSHADDFFGWIYKDEISKIKPTLRVIVSEYPTKISKTPLAEFNEGVYYGYVEVNK